MNLETAKEIQKAFLESFETGFSLLEIKSMAKVPNEEDRDFYTILKDGYLFTADVLWGISERKPNCVLVTKEPV